MNATKILISAIVSATLVIGCGSKNESKTDLTGSTARTSKTPSEKAPKTTSTKKAQGDVRAALLHLRRVHFALDSAELLPASRTALQEAAEHLSAHPDVDIYIDGHTDERGTSEYNLGLGDRRGHVVADYLVNLGIDASRLHIVTFGEEQPWVNGSSETAYAKNRRAEFRLYRGNVRLIVDDGALYNDTGASIAATEDE